MKLSWRHEEDEALFAAEIPKYFSRNDGGEVVVKMLGDEYLFFHQVVAALKLPPTVPMMRAMSLVQKGVLDWVRSKDGSPSGLTERMDAGLQEYLRLPVKRYVLLTTLSFEWDRRIGSQKWNEVQVHFTKRCPASFRQGRNFLQEKAQIFGPIPKNYTWVTVPTSGRCELSAAETGLGNIDAMRGLWNLIVNHRHRRRSIGKTRPVNPIIIGPLHTLHQPTGELAHNNLWWWEPAHIEPVQPYELQPNYLALSKFARGRKRRLAQSRIQDELEDLLRRYARALDYWDQEVAFTKMWAILEVLTNTGYRNYDVTVERATSQFLDRDQHRRELRFIRENRNEVVHKGAGQADTEMLAYTLKFYVETLWLLLSDNAKEFHSLQEFGEFLDLPVEKGQLERKMRLLKLAEPTRR